MAFTDLLDALGGVGRFQLLQTVLLLLPCGLLACHNFLQNFTAAVPSHHCRPPPNSTANNSDAWLRASVPLDHLGLPESCRRFKEPQWALGDPNTSSPEPATEGCVDGWVYDHSIFPSSIVTEVWGSLEVQRWGVRCCPPCALSAPVPSLQWDLVCDKRSLRDLAQSLYMTGVLVGAAIFGSVADR